jgi:ABC-type uncharacterized transport system YnjBCD substrate-binding protein
MEVIYDPAAEADLPQTVEQLEAWMAANPGLLMP